MKKIRQPGGTRGITRDEDESDEEDEGNLAVAPIHQFMGNISKLRRAIKRQAVAPPPQTPVINQPPTTVTKRFLPKTPKRSPFSGYKTFKKPPLSSYKVAKKTPKKAKPPSPASSIFDTAEEDEPVKPVELSSQELAAALPYAGDTSESPWISPSERTSEKITSIKRRLRQLSSEKRKNEGLQLSAQKPKPVASLLTRAQRRAQRKALKKLEPAPGWKPFGTPTKRKLDGDDW